MEEYGISIQLTTTISTKVSEDTGENTTLVRGGIYVQYDLVCVFVYMRVNIFIEDRPVAPIDIKTRAS